MVLKTFNMDKPTETAASPKDNMQQTQARVDEVVDIMRANIEKVLEKDQKLRDLDDRASVLHQQGREFERQAHKLKKRYCWQNIKMLLILGFVGVVLLILIIVAITLSVQRSNNSDKMTATTPLPQAGAMDRIVGGFSG